MTEATTNNQTPQKKLQMAMGLEKPTADFYAKAGIGEPQFRKWKMFFRGRGNTLMGVQILSDYLKERKEKNNNKLPATLDLTKSWQERKFFKEFVNERTKPNETDDRSQYIEEFRMLGMIQGSNTIPEYISKGLEFFGRIFVDIGIVAREKNQSKGLFMQALGFESVDPAQWIKRDEEIGGSRVTVPEELPAPLTTGGAFIGEGFVTDGGQGAQGEGAGLTIEQNTQTDIDLSEEAIETLRRENPLPEEQNEAQLPQENQPEQPILPVMPVTGDQGDMSIPQPEIMESQLGTSFHSAAELTTEGMGAAPQMTEENRLIPMGGVHRFGRRQLLPRNSRLRMPERIPGGTTMNPRPATQPQIDSEAPEEEQTAPQQQERQRQQQQRQQDEQEDQQQEDQQLQQGPQGPLNSGEEQGVPENRPTSRIGRYIWGGSLFTGGFFWWTTSTPSEATTVFLAPIITTLKIAIIHLFSI